MVVRSPVRSPVRNVVQSVFGAAEAFNPFQLFTSGAQGAWYDPSDFSTLYQNAAGTTPVTAVEQPVRLMLDRSKGLVLGSELVNLAALPTPSIANNAGSVGVWDAATRTMSNTGSVSASYPRFQFDFGLVVGRTYFVTGVVSGSLTELNAVRLATSGIINVAPYNSATGVFSGYVVAAASSLEITTNLDGAESLTITSLSIRELPGNHATAPNDASRPVLRSRYNLLTRSEEFDDAAWSKVNATVTANAGVAPDGTTTADAIVANGSGSPDVRQTVGTTAGVTYTQTQFVKYTNNTWVCLRYLAGSEEGRAWFNIQDGSVGARSGIATSSTVTALGGGWFRIAAVFAVTITAASPTFRLHLATANNDGLATVSAAQSCNLWGASLLTAADQSATGGAYQRVGAATDYDTGPPWRPYLAFDGSDDSMSTSSIDFSGTDKMTVFAGVSKLSDAALGMLAELSVNAGTENGSFFLAAPRTTTTADFGFRSTGTTLRDATSAASYSAPTTRVLTGIGDISGDVATLRIDGAEVATNTNDQGTGNFGNYPLFIGRRNNSSFPFNGRLYGLTVLGRTATASEIGAMESWIAGKTGVNL